jgi:hypothetical protein
MSVFRNVFSILFVLLFGLFLGCWGPLVPVDGPQTSPLVEASLAPRATPMPIRLVVLHTNDNWGETEPCG